LSFEEIWGEKMKALILGSGGREHALAWKIGQSVDIEEIYCAPGNAGTANIAENVQLNYSDFSSMADFVEKNSIGLTVVGPEAPLVDSIVDYFEKRNLAIVGPKKDAAVLEGSKVFTKGFLKKYNMPTANFNATDNPEEAKRFCNEHFDNGVVVKADGLAAGKGVIVCSALEEAISAVEDIMVKKIFGDAGNKVVIEQRLYGEEASFIALTDGKYVLPLASSQDHKRVFDNDQGKNTGGMGAYSPAPVIKDLEQEIMDTIMYPAINGMRSEGFPYKGVLYAGIMVVDNKPYVLEFNCRMGDPETQPVVVRMKSDIVPYLKAVVEGNLAEAVKERPVEWDERAAVCVVMASKGYPDNYAKGKEIFGLNYVKRMPGVVVFHAGTKSENGKILTSGGRVLGVTALGNTIKDAQSKAYEAVKKISWDGLHYRTDVGSKALR
jgi:phosphoribosylamine--glycine ligase